MVINKEKQKEDIIQDEEVFIYKPYDISSKPSRSKTSESIFIQEKAKILEKVLKMLQSPTKIILFLLLSHYKAL